jgi:hypothetical protein
MLVFLAAGILAIVPVRRMLKNDPQQLDSPPANASKLQLDKLDRALIMTAALLVIIYMAISLISQHA